MKIAYTFYADDQESRTYFENGHTYYLGLDDLYKLYKRLQDDFVEQELVSEEIKRILVESKYFED